MMAKSPPELNAVITQRIEVAPGLIVLRVVPDGWELADFLPGQYSVLGLPGSAPRCEGADPEEPPPDDNKLIRRAYSIASSSQAREYLEFYLALVRSGALTPRLFALNVGDRVWLGRKMVGMFTLDQVPQDMNVILFSTGTGVAPYMSMVRTAVNRAVGRRFAVVHGARHSWDLGYESELVTLERTCPDFDYVPIISRPNEEPVRWGGLTGYCQDVWRKRVVDGLWGLEPRPENTHIFLCGNPAMIEDMTALLANEGFREHSKKSPGEVHLEKYW
jgi:ferredoxin--NADP+ reductase